MANYIGNQPLNGEFKVLDSIESQFNNSSTSFGLKYNTASQTVGDAAQLIVSLNGVIQQPLTSYTLSGVTNIVFASPPSSGDTCFIILLGGVGGTVTPSDNSVTTEKLTNSSVTSAKIVNNTITADDMDSSDSYAFAGVNVGTTFVTDTVNDRIGVGTTNPTYPLDVEDDGAGFIKGSFVSTGSSHSSITFDNTGSAAASVRVGSNNDDFYVRTSGSEKLRVTSAGNVGIGETSPAYPLDINGGTENVVVRISSTDADALMVFEDNSTTDRVLLGAQGEDFLLRTDLGKFTFRVNNNATDGMVILNNGNVGIGTSSPSKSLHILNTSATGSTNPSHLRIEGNNSNYYDIGRDNSGTGFLSFYGSQTGATGYIFGGVDGERLRIDSSGNLLVGTTNSTPHNLTSGGGLSVRGSINLFSIARQDNEVMIVNRTGTDGDIALFRKNGSTVGSIGVYSSDFYIGNPDESLIRFGNNQIAPAGNDGSDRDNAINIGGSGGRRFKDLFLSGGVYLGGTGSANYLDDYEEGYHDTTVTIGSGTFTYNNRRLRYIKVGNVCHVFGRLRTVQSANDVSSYSFTLPFTSQGSSEYETAHVMQTIRATDNVSVGPLGMRNYRIILGSAAARMQADGSDSGNFGNTDIHINVSFTYYTV